MNEIDEDEVIGAGRKGAILDGAADGAKRAVQAALLRRCCHELRDQIDPHGLRLTNTIVLGCLDLTGLAVPFPLRFDRCEFDAPPVVEGAELFELSLTGCPRLPGLLGKTSSRAALVFDNALPRVLRACILPLRCGENWPGIGWSDTVACDES